jgi:hypothetical protein
VKIIRTQLHLDLKIELAEIHAAYLEGSVQHPNKLRFLAWLRFLARYSAASASRTATLLAETVLLLLDALSYRPTHRRRRGEDDDEPKGDDT